MLIAPFQIEELKQIVSGKIKSPVIDFKNSKIKNQSLLTYIYNLNLQNATIDIKDTELLDRRNLFLSFLNHKTTVEVVGLTETYIKFLFALKGITVRSEDQIELDQLCIFSDSEINDMMQSDTEVRDAIEHAAFLLDGIVVHLMLSLNDIHIELDGDFGKVGVVKDPGWIGHTWINLIKHPIFSIYYYSIMPPLAELVYFPYQYSEPIYKGKTLLNYLTEYPFLTSVMKVGLEHFRETVQ
jgi:hypothetical protein